MEAIDSEWIEQSLLSVNKASIRHRRLPAQQAVWLVLWMGLISKTHKPYPQLRLVSLISTETRMVLGAAFDGCHVGESTLAQRLVQDIPDHSLTLFDRCYFSAD